MDRKLDTWVAENVFNLEVREHPVCGGYEYDSGVWFDPLPNYTSDMNVSIHVLAELSAINGQHGYDFYYDGVGRWSVVMNYDQLGDTFRQLSSHKDPAMAICLAAYKLKTGNDWREVDE